MRELSLIRTTLPSRALLKPFFGLFLAGALFFFGGSSESEPEELDEALKRSWSGRSPTIFRSFLLYLLFLLFLCFLPFLRSSSSSRSSSEEPFLGLGFFLTALEGWEQAMSSYQSPRTTCELLLDSSLRRVMVLSLLSGRVL